MIVQELIEHANAHANGRKINDIRLGLGYTAVVLDDGSCGLSYTFRRELGYACGIMEGAGTLTGMDGIEAAAWAMDTGLAKSSVGIATINAILSHDLSGFTIKNALDEIDIHPGDVVGMVGYFEPVLRQWGQMADKVFIFDRAVTADVVLPDWAENIYLPTCDVVIITGTTLINKTIDHVLSLCQNAREIVIMGPTTCLVPAVFRRHGVHVLAGSRVVDAPSALRVVSQGGGGMDMQNCIEQLCLRL